MILHLPAPEPPSQQNPQARPARYRVYRVKLTGTLPLPQAVRPAVFHVAFSLCGMPSGLGLSGCVSSNVYSLSRPQSKQTR